MHQCLIDLKVNFEKNFFFFIETFPFLILTWRNMLLQHPIKSSLRSIICKVVTCNKMLKTKENFKGQGRLQKVFTYKRFQIKFYSELTGKRYFVILFLESWSLRSGGHFREVFATGCSTV